MTTHAATCWAAVSEVRQSRDGAVHKKGDRSEVTERIQELRCILGLLGRQEPSSRDCGRRRRPGAPFFPLELGAGRPAGPAADAMRPAACARVCCSSELRMLLVCVLFAQCDSQSSHCVC